MNTKSIFFLHEIIPHNYEYPDTGSINASLTV